VSPIDHDLQSSSVTMIVELQSRDELHSSPVAKLAIALRIDVARSERSVSVAAEVSNYNIGQRPRGHGNLILSEKA
jgi:hypothetical protein